jgi:hypothetical protein
MELIDKMAKLLEQIKPLVGIGLPLDQNNLVRGKIGELLREYEESKQPKGIDIVVAYEAKKRGKK